MEWNSDSIDRLYVLYQQYIDQLREDVIAANRSMGSKNPEKTKLKQLTRPEFETVLTAKSSRSEQLPSWVKRFIRGHETKFPELAARRNVSSAVVPKPHFRRVSLSNSRDLGS